MAVKSTASPTRPRTRGPRAATKRSPLSVSLSTDLRRRLAAQAKRRDLKVATAARTFIAERLDELDTARETKLAEEWQRREALRTWDRISKAGDWREVSKAQIDRGFAVARRKLAARARRSA